MSEESKNHTPTVGRTVFRLLKVAVVTILLLFLFLFLVAGVGSGGIEAFIAITFGWLQFLKRTIPQISWNWDLIAMGILASLFILALAHWLLKWATSGVFASQGQGRRWPWRWTWCGLVAVALLFLVGMSVGGAAHQIGWMAASKEPLFERKGRRFYEYNNMRQLELAFRMALGDENGSLNKTRQALWKTPNDYFGQLKWMQTYHLLVVTKNDGTLGGLIVFPRDASVFKEVGLYCSVEGQERVNLPIAQLSGLLQKYQGYLIAF